MAITRLVYYSQNHIDPGAGSVVRVLSSILSSSNRNNRAAGLTGALIFDNQWFLQALEGERDSVWSTFNRIREDDRHSNVTIAELVQVDRRAFGNWWMGLATRQPSTEHIFSAYAAAGRLDPRILSGRQILGLMIALAAFGLAREVIAHAA